MNSMGRIFICYRREDTAPYAGRLHDRLVARFGSDRVFMDIEAIGPGEDWQQAIERTLVSASVVLVLIGKRWCDMRDEQGKPRLDDPGDVVRLEVSTALARGVRVVPLLLGGASMPTVEALPEPMRKLAQRNSMEISDARFNYDTDRMVEAVERDLGTRVRLGALLRRHRATGASVAVSVVAALALGLYWLGSSEGNSFNGWKAVPAGEAANRSERPKTGEEVVSQVAKRSTSQARGELATAERGSVAGALDRLEKSRESLEVANPKQRDEGSAPVGSAAVAGSKSGFGSIGALFQDDRVNRGVQVVGFTRRSPARASGLRAGDLIVGFRFQNVDSAGQLTRLLLETPPGESVALTIRRAEVVKSIDIVVGELQPEEFGQLRHAVDNYNSKAKAIIQSIGR